MNQVVRPLSPLDSLFADDGAIAQSARTVLHAAREHLGMDVAFISEFHDDGSRIIRYVDNRDPRHAPLTPGSRLPLHEGYCQRVVEGSLPELIPDTSLLPAALDIPATRHLPIGAHLSVPIRLADGRIYGTFCCFSFIADRSLNARDLGMMHALADLVGRQLDRELVQVHEHEAVAERITEAMVNGQPQLVYQPICLLARNCRICGVEALSRFHTVPARGPEDWFADAGRVGLGTMLELHTIRRALQELSEVPGDFYVSVNCSPDTLLAGELADVLSRMAPERLVLEITEHAQVDDYEPLSAALAPLRSRGMRLAIDDAGAGYASMRHILRLQPDIIKLDTSLTKGIDRDRHRRSLANALVGFAGSIGSTIIAEGVETREELATLHELGVHKVQGYLLHKPMPMGNLRMVLQDERDKPA